MIRTIRTDTSTRKSSNGRAHRVGRRLVCSERGAAMVEFAIVLPVFLLIAWGVIDFGRLFFTSNSLANAVREGGRYAAVLQDPIGSAAAVKTKVKQSFVPFGGPSLTDAEISIDTTTIAGGVIVTITGYPAPVLTPLSAVIGSTSTMTRSATFRRERSG